MTDDQLTLEEREAWLEYRHAIHGLPTSSVRYAEVEPWAWARLQLRRRQISRARSREQVAA